MTKTNISIKRYDVGGGFYLDVVENRIVGEREVWIANNAYAVSMLMWGELIETESHKDFLKLVKANLPEYIEIYKNKYFED